MIYAPKKKELLYTAYTFEMKQSFFSQCQNQTFLSSTYKLQTTNLGANLTLPKKQEANYVHNTHIFDLIYYLSYLEDFLLSKCQLLDHNTCTF